jgi:RNA 2',3'-cyclic 3'-phosphodiesterase
MRIFIAIELTEEIRSALAALQDDLRRAHADVSWTKPDNQHLTLKFLGEVEEQRIKQIAHACQAAVIGVSPFIVSIKDTGAFPNLKQPRVLWAGLAEGITELRELHTRLDEQLSALGFEKEGRAFKPHLTLGRVKSAKNTAALVSHLTAYRLPSLSFTACEIVVVRSQLHPDGSIYTPLAKLAFD